MSIDEKAFMEAWEQVRDGSDDCCLKHRMQRFLEAYEAAKAPATTTDAGGTKWDFTGESAKQRCPSPVSDKPACLSESGEDDRQAPIMGDASARKDEEAIGETDAATSAKAAGTSPLSPCPFCGNDAGMVNEVRDGNRPHAYGVACDICSAEVSGYHTPEHATRLWNSRPCLRQPDQDDLDLRSRGQDESHSTNDQPVGMTIPTYGECRAMVHEWYYQGTSPLLQAGDRLKNVAFWFQRYLVSLKESLAQPEREAAQPVEKPQPKPGNMRECPYPTKVMTEGQIESFIGHPIDDINPNLSYNLSGVHLWQFLDGYRSMLPKRESGDELEKWKFIAETFMQADDARTIGGVKKMILAACESEKQRRRGSGQL